MARAIQCPKCGAPNELANPGIVMLVCGHCQSIVHWGDGQLHLGEKAIVPESDSRLFMFAQGTVGGTPFQVVGHVRYDYDRGGWDEWYLSLANGEFAWLSEDQRQLTFQREVEPQGPTPLPRDLAVGLPLNLGGYKYSVREMGAARCVGGEGQLPFVVLPGEHYTYAEVVTDDGQHFGTLEYDRGGKPTCFIGNPIGHQDLSIEGEPPPSTARPGKGQNIECTNCRAAIEVPGDRHVETKVCEYCGAQLDLSSQERAVLGVNPPDIHFDFEVGDSCQFDGARYEVCGRMLYLDYEHYATREYLLYNPDRGYLWLAEENQHWVLNRPTKKAPPGDVRYVAQKLPVEIGDDKYKVYEHCSGSLDYVDGALPWRAAVGDRWVSTDLIAPPKMFSAEYEDNEVEYFEGDYLTARQVWEAFGREPGDSPRSHGVHGAQPFQRSRGAFWLMTLGLVFGLLNASMLLWSLKRDGINVYSGSFSAEEYVSEALSEPFAIPKASILTLETSAPVDNSWIAASVAMVNEKDEVVAEMAGDVSYYYGYEGGESWSEGARSQKKYWRAPEAGTYRLIIKGDSGSGMAGPGRGESISLSLRAGGILSRYFLAAMILCFLFPIFEITRKSTFETRRWSNVIDDDDDDDDDSGWDWDD
jgi:hypothetical protein